MTTPFRIALLDDYQQVGVAYSDGLPAESGCVLESFGRKLQASEMASELAKFDALVLMRDRTKLDRESLGRLPKLRFISVVGQGLGVVDLEAASELGIVVSHTQPDAHGLDATAEFTWGLVLAVTRGIAREDANTQAGRWQGSLPGRALRDRTLGIAGLGRIGQRVARFGHAFGMQVIAWSENLTEAVAKSHGTELVAKDALFARSDVLSLHLKASPRTRGVISTREFGLMKRSAFFVNTARAELVDSAALLRALKNSTIAGAALDVYPEEPLESGSEWLGLDNLLTTPHLAHVTEDTLREGYRDSAFNIRQFLAGTPVRVLNPPAGS